MLNANSAWVLEIDYQKLLKRKEMVGQVKDEGLT
jgi:hypothetical protein